MGAGPQAVVWLGEEDFDTESQRAELQAMAEYDTVFIVESRGASMTGEIHILRRAPIGMGRPLVVMWTYDLLCVADVLSRQEEFNKVLVAGRRREMGLACLLASLLTVSSIADLRGCSSRERVSRPVCDRQRQVRRSGSRDLPRENRCSCRIPP
jgi:hypothetical protein